MQYVVKMFIVDATHCEKLSEVCPRVFLFRSNMFSFVQIECHIEVISFAS